MTDDNGYSGLIKSLKASFDAYASAGNRYLLVYWQGWSETMSFEPVRKSAYPWTVHDLHMAESDSADPCILAMALDLQQEFSAQIPVHMRQFETLDSFGFRPLVHIPDREGVVPFEIQERQRRALLYPKPRLALVN